MTAMADELPDDDPDSSFEWFYRRTLSRVFGRALTMARGQRHVAADAVQEAYVELLKRWPSRCYRDFEENRKYLLAIACNKVIDHFRRTVGLRECELDEGIVDTSSVGVDIVIDRMTVAEAVRKFLGSLPPRQVAVAELHFREGYSYNEVAEMLDISESTVRTHVKHIRDASSALRKFLDADQGGKL